jgi:hypothetical protein
MSHHCSQPMSTTFPKGNYCIWVFLVHQEALINVHMNIFFNYIKLAFRDYALDMFKSYLSSHTQRVELNGCLSDILSISCGVIQVSLFFGFINDIFNATSLATFYLLTPLQYLHSRKQKSSWLQKPCKLANKIAADVSKTNFIILHARGKKVDLLKMATALYLTVTIYTDTLFSYLSLIHNLERIHDDHNDVTIQSFKLHGVFLDEHYPLTNMLPILPLDFQEPYTC